MMTLVTGKIRPPSEIECRNSRAGFTLVELLIVLVILTILAAAAVPSVESVMDERRAREPVAELHEMAREVRNRALAEQRPYQIIFLPDGFHAARYFNPYGGKEEFDKLQDLLKMQQEQLEIIEASRERAMAPASEKVNPRYQAAVKGLRYSRSYEMPGDVRFRLRAWNDTDWREMESGAFYRWVFQPSGMCEPLKVQFQHEKAFFEIQFHPLTADIKSETSWIE